jgi:hypothetical protein
VPQAVARPAANDRIESLDVEAHRRLSVGPKRSEAKIVIHPTAQPPHRQAANHHRRVVSQLDGAFVVTMEHPSKMNPKAFGYEITAFGIALIVAAPMVSVAAASSTPRAG